MSRSMEKPTPPSIRLIRDDGPLLLYVAVFLIGTVVIVNLARIGWILWTA